nr:hypothetical protein [Brucella pituitosa]
MLAQDVLRHKPTSGAVFAFRGRRGDRVSCCILMAGDFAFIIKFFRAAVSPDLQQPMGRLD